jgi:NADH-quinone oxidoreductase subunit A
LGLAFVLRKHYRRTKNALKRGNLYFSIGQLAPIFVHIILVFMTILQATQTPTDYAPILVQLGIAIGFVALMMGGTHLLGPRRKTDDKLANFECGIEEEGNARQPVAVKYFLVAILFVLFDVEVIFFYPYAMNFRELGWEGFLAVAMFVGFFIVGFTYIIRKGALLWED